MKTIASSAQPELRSAAATFNPKPEALIASSAARDGPQTMQETQVRATQIEPHKSTLFARIEVGSSTPASKANVDDAEDNEHNTGEGPVDETTVAEPCKH